MSDRYAARITIGGQASRTAKSKTDPDETVLEALLGVIRTSEVTYFRLPDYGDKVVDPHDEIELMEFVTEDGDNLQFCDDQAPNGEFPDLEEFCRTEGLSFCRESSMYGGYLAEEVTWLPGMVEPLTILEDDHGHEQVSGETVREALKLLRESTRPIPWFAFSRSIWTADIDKLAIAREILAGLCPDRITIPKFEVLGLPTMA